MVAGCQTGLKIAGKSAGSIFLTEQEVHQCKLTYASIRIFSCQIPVKWFADATCWAFHILQTLAVTLTDKGKTMYS